jgi:hypothetical protein
VRVVDLSWLIPGEEPLLRVDSLHATIAPSQLLRGEFVIRRLAIYSPVIRLTRAAGERGWNFERALADLLSGERAPAPAARPRRLILIEDAIIENGSVTVRPPSGHIVAFRNISARAPLIAISGPGQTAPRVELASLAATLRLPTEELEVAVAISNAEFGFPAGRIDFPVARIMADSTLFTGARGEYRFGARGLGLNASVRGERVRLADLRILFPRAPAQGTAAFDLKITTNVAGRSTLELSALDIRAEGSYIHGSLGLADGAGRAGPNHALELSL